MSLKLNELTVTNAINGSITGNAATATSATDSTKLPLAGGTLTGQLNINHSTPASILRLYSAGSTIWSLGVGDASGSYFNITADFGSFTINKTNGYVGIGTTAPATLLGIGTGTPTGATLGIQFGSDTSARLYRTGPGIITCPGTIAATFSGSLTGNATNVTGTVVVANGGTGGTTQAAGRTGLGATTVGANLFTLANPSAIRFIRINADNTVSALSDTDFRTAIGAGTGGGSGTVTTVSVVSANGFAGTVANATTTPAITLTTSVTGVLKGNGTAISAATSGTDYLAPNTSITVNQLTATQAIIQKKVQPASNISGNVAVTIDVSSANVHVLTLDNGAVINSFSYTNRAADGAVNTILLVIKYLGTSASITWSNVIWANGNDPTLTKVNGYADVYALTSYKGTSGFWIGTVVAQNLLSTNL
jgi:hypothetical protein